MTTAKQIARQFNGDGVCMIDAEGTDLDTACIEAGACRVDGEDGARYVFDDYSTITIFGDYWDLGYPGCFCWPSEGHRSRCAA